MLLLHRKERKKEEGIAAKPVAPKAWRRRKGVKGTKKARNVGPESFRPSVSDRLEGSRFGVY
jgi:hypothetical protein